MIFAKDGMRVHGLLCGILWFWPENPQRLLGSAQTTSVSNASFRSMISTHHHLGRLARMNSDLKCVLAIWREKALASETG